MQPPINSQDAGLATARADRDGKKGVLQLEICKPLAFPSRRGKLNQNKLVSNLVQVSSLVLPILALWLPGRTVPSGLTRPSVYGPSC